MFCLKHSAELDCYGRGGLSKPRCTRSGWDREHTPDLHMLMSGGDAEVNLVAGNEDEGSFGFWDEYEDGCEYEWEYKDGGLWVGTVSAAADLEGGERALPTAGARALAPSGDQLEERETLGSCEEESDFQVEGGSEEEAAGGGWWDQRSESPEPEDAGINTLLAGILHHPLRTPPRLGHPASGGQRVRERRGTATDQQWEEARHRARLWEVADNDLVSEGDDEELPGEWGLEPFEPP